MRQVDVVESAKTKLKHFHPRQAELFPELLNVGRDDSEILGHQRDIAQRLANSGKKPLPGGP